MKINHYLKIVGVAILSVIFSLPVKAGVKSQFANQKDSTLVISRDELLDKIYGGWVGMLIGGLEGLSHEFKYNENPRESLPDFGYLEHGATSDDDNDFELTHLYFMDKEKVLEIPYSRIAEIWKANMKTGIWAANAKARDLINDGMIPPATGSSKNNDKAVFNLSGQFCTESYGLIAPGMPNTASEIGTHYAHISVCCEPIQAAQFWTSLISLNLIDQSSIEDLIVKALKSVDPNSVMNELVTDAIKTFRDNPNDWKTARQTIYAKWLIEKKWNGNSTPTNGGMVILSLLYGEGDFYKTLQYAMAMGIDADCNAATSGVIAGSRLGFRKMIALSGFKMPDHFVNKTRPQLPAEMKISEQADLLLRVAEKVILANGGKKIKVNGKPGYRIRLQNPNIVEYLNN